MFCNFIQHSTFWYDNKISCEGLHITSFQSKINVVFNYWNYQKTLKYFYILMEVEYPAWSNSCTYCPLFNCSILYKWMSRNIQCNTSMLSSLNFRTNFNSVALPLYIPESFNNYNNSFTIWIVGFFLIIMILILVDINQWENSNNSFPHISGI